MTDRAPSFGYGQKIDLAVNNKVPPPNRYELKGEFQEDHDKHRGWSFCSDKKKGIINEKESKVKPGPGAYEANKYGNHNYVNLSYTMGCRTADSESKHRNVPQIANVETGPRPIQHDRDEQHWGLLLQQIQKFSVWENWPF